MSATADVITEGDLCEACGASLKRHRHGLTPNLLVGLQRLARVGRANLKDLRLTRNQWDNFQKLRYWGLVSPVFEGGTRRRGVWSITPLGRAFLANEASVHRYVWTFRGRVDAVDGALVGFADINGETQ